MGNKKTKRFISSVLAFAMVVTGSACYHTDVAQAAKKASLKTKKISINVGKTKKIAIKNKKAKAVYSFQSSKKKVASVSKKGTVTAKKAGTAKITVKESLKSKVKKLGVVKVTVEAAEKEEIVQTQSPVTSAIPAASVSPTPVATATVTAKPVVTEAPASAKPTSAPSLTTVTDEELAGITWTALDLSTYTGYETVTDDNVMYDTATGVLNAKNQEIFGIPLNINSDMNAGEYVYVKVKGTNNGAAGFRSWLVDGQSTTCCANPDGLYFFTEAANSDFTVGDFEITYKLTATAECSYLFFKGPSYGVNIEDLSISSIDVCYSDKKVVEAYTPTEEENAKMIKDSLVSSGNNARIKKVIENAKAGKDVTIAYLGGSITEGQGASPNSNCYAEASCNAFASKYGTGSNVHFVNAGMSGTPSSLGIVRYDRDVLGQMTVGDHPDILFLEFAVNDSGECTNGGAYEGIIRRALASGSAVVLMFSVFRDDFNMQTTYIPFGTHYDLPMISMKNAVDNYLDKYDGFRKWYFSDQYHPTNAGYELTSNCIMNLFDTIDKETADTDNVTDISTFAAYKSDSFTNTTMLGPDTVEDLLKQTNSALTSFSAGGFTATDTSTGEYLYDKNISKFSTNWMHTAATTDDAFTANVKCKNMLIVYKLSKAETTGSADLYVDGVKKTILNGFNRSGWNNADTVLAFNDDEVKDHKIEIKMSEGNEDKEFTILAIGYN